MGYIYKLAGELLELSEAELNSFLRSQGIDELCEREGRLAFTEAEPSQLRRLGLVHEVCREVDIDELRVSGKYAVRAENLSDDSFDSKSAEKRIGNKLSRLSNQVDLENPDTVVKIYNNGKNMAYGVQIDDIPRGKFEQRSNEERPYSSPVSLDPVLARVLVNLSEASFGEYLLDPFCGTGGILIEAGLCGIGVQGIDIQKDMVLGTRRNLEEYGVISHQIIEGDINESLDRFDETNVIVTDLPYGKASRSENRPIEKFLELIDDFEGKIVFMYNEPRLDEFRPDFELEIHRSLTRYIYRV